MKSSASPAGGEIIQVQGGHIIRSTGRKDRHSKVYTAKGPRDRRVRLSAHTAIQFYDVQDRLGYDRPSKAVDWLINKAKSAIDKLAELPPWHPNAANTSTANADPNGDKSTEMAIQEQTDTLGYHNNFQFQRQLAAHGNNNDSSSFIPQPLDSEAIADTMRSFFPTSSANASSMNYQSYPHHEMISTSTNPSEDLGLSLHSYHEPGLLHAGQSQEQNTQVAPTNDHHHHQTLFGAAGGYDNSMVAWSSEGNRGGGGGYMFHSQPLHQQQGGTAEALMGHHGSAAFTQRGTLQSSFIPSIRAWENFSVDKAQASIFSGRFSSDGLPVFWMPEQSRGQGGHGGVVSDHRPSSSSPSSHQ